MIIVDTALKQRAADNNPVRVGMVGAGFMAKGIALQIQKYTPGMELVAIANRTLDNAVRAYAGAGVDEVTPVESLAALEDTARKGGHAVTSDAKMLCEAGNIDAIIEVTGAVEHGAQVALHAIEHGKHIILMDAEMDSTVGPLLKRYADRAGVVYTNTDGDQPGVIMNLYRFVEGLGVRPVLCGNIKGLQDPYRNPTTQAAFAK
ncbi:MAG TPA: NAD(P)-dependent oxidoreductase, partial [Chromatiales bacterium]|nr:NAD(P)-dependent oxidoreductase [Chromatiales bacterium]